MDPLNLNSIVFNQKREPYENTSLEITFASNYRKIAKFVNN